MGNPVSKSRKGSRWPYLVAGLLAIPVVVDVGVIVLVGSDPSFAVEPQYYQKAVKWDDEMAQRRKNAELGWKADVRVSASPEGPHLVVRLVDRLGVPLRGARVTAETFHNARASQVLKADLTSEGDAYGAALPMQRPGLWEVRLRVEHGGATFTQVERLDVVGGRSVSAAAPAGRGGTT